MNLEDKKKVVIDLIGTFQTASKLSLSLRKKGLKETIKEDNTPVTNGDLEVNKLLIDKISKLTPDILIVSVTNDKFVNKGPGKPVFNETLRSEAIQSLESVDYVVVNDAPTAINPIKIIKPNVFIIGTSHWRQLVHSQIQIQAGHFSLASYRSR